MEPPFPWALALSAGASVASSFANKGGISLQTLRRRGRFVLDQQRPVLLQAYAKARGKTQEALDTVRTGNVNALRATEDAQNTSMRLGLEATRQASQQLGQSSTSRGLGGTSIAGADQRAFSETSSRVLDEISARGGAARAGIYQQGAAQEAELLSDLGRLYQMQYQSEASDYFSPLFDILTAGGGGGGQQGGGGVDMSGLYALLKGAGVS